MWQVFNTTTEPYRLGVAHIRLNISKMCQFLDTFTWLNSLKLK